LRIFTILFFTLFISSTNAFAICDQLYLQEITDDGNTIILNNGKIWKAVNPGFSAIGWDINDDVVMCGDGVMINHDQNERIAVSRIK
jgi:hypothetical protein